MTINSAVTEFFRTCFKTLKKVHLTVWIFVAMGLGIIIGIILPHFSTETLNLLSQSIFLPMIKACIVPLVFSTLVTGIAGHGDEMSRIGRMAWKTILYFITLTFFALMIGLGIVNIIKPGQNITLNQAKYNNSDTSHISVKDELHKLFQPSFFQAAVGFRLDGTPAGNGGEVLAIVFMAVLFSLGIMNCKIQEAKKIMLDFNFGLSNVMFSVVNLVMMFAPFGIFGAMAAAVGNSGNLHF